MAKPTREEVNAYAQEVAQHATEMADYVANYDESESGTNPPHPRPKQPPYNVSEV